MAGSLTPNEEAQLAQTIEMFEVITQSQPLDYASLEILKEAYIKLERHKDVVNTSKRIAQAYVQLGQLSSAILEYEGILQQFPDDPDVRAALAEIEDKASSLAVAGDGGEAGVGEAMAPEQGSLPAASPTEVDDGRVAMHKLFVEGKLMSNMDFDQLWLTPDLNEPPSAVTDPFIQQLADRGVMGIEQSLKLLSERTRCPYVPLATYDVDVEVARSFPRDLCVRWAVLPFDRMSKSVLVATANPWNKHAAWELENCTKSHLIWYLTHPGDLTRSIRKYLR
jgi:hypothetical protein